MQNGSNKQTITSIDPNPASIPIETPMKTFKKMLHHLHPPWRHIISLWRTWELHLAW